jgi:hypothetical protein
MNALKATCCLGLAVLLSSCGGHREVVPGIAPVRNVEYQKHWITITPVDGTSAVELVNTGLFHGIKPGTKHDEVMKLLGPPTNKRSHEHSLYYEYFFGDGRLEVGREEYSSGGEPSIAWSLTSYPNNQLYRDVLISAAAESIQLRSSNSVIQICDDSKEIRLLIVISGERV